MLVTSRAGSREIAGFTTTGRRPSPMAPSATRFSTVSYSTVGGVSSPAALALGQQHLINQVTAGHVERQQRGIARRQDG